MKPWLKVAIAAALVLPPLGLAASATGLIPIAASKGHWAVTEWFLEFSMRRSVATHSLTIEVPDDLHDPALALRGAGHYETGCRMCHGAPGLQAMPPVPHAMTPAPPVLDAPLAELDPAETFYVVKHGVKMTGMPAWPAQHRDDEVWAVVAFLQHYPELRYDNYVELALPDEPLSADVPTVVAKRCVRCHGADGMGRMPGAFPRLAGQREAYLRLSLQAYAEGERHSGMMQPVAFELTESQREEAAAYYASLPPMRGEPSEPSALGEKLATEGIPERNLPSCNDCHGEVTEPRHQAYPNLAGQDQAYLKQQLQLFQSEHRGGTRFAKIMRTAVSHDLKPEEIEAVTHHYATTPQNLAAR